MPWGSRHIFFSFWWPLIVLIDFPEILRIRPVAAVVSRVSPLERWLERLEGTPVARDGTEPTAFATAAFIVGGLLVFLMGVAGISSIHSFPLSSCFTSS
ncbi:MAG TPA: hypothetical protein VH062_26340 [Polyangiaceae bacterium]|nr:hypothetical protein [Polyangiaceae bacterium]